MTTRERTRRLRIVTGVGIAAAVAAIAGLARRGRRRAAEHEREEPADVGFMIAMHAALRRDVAHLESVAPVLDARRAVPPSVEDGWRRFRDRLLRHHDAEDENLWPALRARLRRPADLREVDAMVEEHRALHPAIAAVDAALRAGARVTPSAGRLASMVRRHLDHEERAVLPLVESHLSSAEWHHFLDTERHRTPFGDRPAFLAWVLEDASERDTAAVMAELPPPGRVVFRRIIRPRVAAGQRW